MVTVIFACVHNAGRSQMAEAFFNRAANPSLARAISAGTRPAEHVHSTVVAVMAEVGVDLISAQPRLLTADLAATGQLLVTMGCGEECPIVPGLRREDWPLRDPKDQPIETVRLIRDSVHRRVLALVHSNGWSLT